MEPRRCAVLAYHKVGAPSAGAWETWFYVPDDVFDQHLRCIHDSGWTPVSAAAFAAGLVDPGRLPMRSVLITFDDGYLSVLRVALPLLTRFGYPGVMFVPVRYAGATNEFDAGIEPTEPICSWDELRALERGGISVESHGCSHVRLSTLAPADYAQELLVSRQTLEQRLDKRVTLFSYPYGDCGTDADAAAAILTGYGYRAAFLYGGGVAAIPAPRPFLLPRIAMGPDTDLRAILSIDAMCAADPRPDGP